MNFLIQRTSVLKLKVRTCLKCLYLSKQMWNKPYVENWFIISLFVRWLAIDQKFGLQTLYLVHTYPCFFLQHKTKNIEKYNHGSNNFFLELLDFIWFCKSSVSSIFMPPFLEIKIEGRWTPSVSVINEPICFYNGPWNKKSDIFTILCRNGPFLLEAIKDMTLK